MLEVILLERIEKLGQMGDVVRVRPGYARNFLLPQGKALRASKGNMALFEARRAQLEAENLHRREEAERVAQDLGGMVVTLIRASSEAGMLYGSVSTRDIADQVTENGITIAKSQIALDKPLKELGLFPVRIKLHPEVFVEVTVNIARSMDEAEMQMERGGAVTQADLDREEDEAARAEMEAAIAEAAAENEAEAEAEGIAGTGEQPD